MKHHVGEVISVYDGDFIGWTTAELTECINESGVYERWRMITREGSELIRLAGFDGRYREKPLNLYRSILFKRSKNAEWQEGTLVISDSGETILDMHKVPVEQVYKYKSNWFK